MQKLTRTDLTPIDQYEAVRDDFRQEIMAYKRRRRVNLGPDLALTFEDRKTMTFQIQEMMRAEKMVTAEAIEAELEVYNSLIPERGELSATLFIEITQESQIKTKLHRFIGLTEGEHLWIEAGGQRSYGLFEQGRSTEDQISSVHYLRFPIPSDLLENLRNPALQAGLAVAHKDYRYTTALPDETRQALIGDLVED